MNKPWNPWGFQPQIWWFMVIMYENLGWKTDGYKPWKMMESMRIEKPHFHGDWIIKYGDLSIKSRDGTRKKKVIDHDFYPQKTVYIYHMCILYVYYTYDFICVCYVYIYIIIIIYIIIYLIYCIWLHPSPSGLAAGRSSCSIGPAWSKGARGRASDWNYRRIHHYQPLLTHY